MKKNKYDKETTITYIIMIVLELIIVAGFIYEAINDAL